MAGLQLLQTLRRVRVSHCCYYMVALLDELLRELRTKGNLVVDIKDHVQF